MRTTPRSPAVAKKWALWDSPCLIKVSTGSTPGKAEPVGNTARPARSTAQHSMAQEAALLTVCSGVVLEGVATHPLLEGPNTRVRQVVFPPHKNVPQVSAGLPAPYHKGGTCCQALMLHLGCGLILARRESHDTITCHTAERALSHFTESSNLTLTDTTDRIHTLSQHMLLTLCTRSAGYSSSSRGRSGSSSPVCLPSNAS